MPGPYPQPQDNPLNWEDPFRDFGPSQSDPFPPEAEWQHLDRNRLQRIAAGSLVEVHGSRVFNYQGNAFRATRIFQSPWETKVRWLCRLMGYPVLGGIGTQEPYVARNIPYEYQFYDDKVPGLEYDDDARAGARLWATAVEMVEPKGPAVRNRATELTADTDYPYAHMKITFEGVPYSVHGDDEVNKNSLGVPVDYGREEQALSRFVTRIIQPQIEVLRLPFGYYKWADGIKYSGIVKADRGGAVTTGYFKMLPYSEITYIWHQVPELPRNAAWYILPKKQNGDPVKENPQVGASYTHVGCVNDDWFDGFPPESLLLTACEARMYKWVTGQRLYDYVYKCKYMNPLDEIPTGAALYYKTGGVETTDTAKGVGGYTPRALGHNHFLRYAFPKDTSSLVEPFYSYMTHNGERDGKPIYAKRDFRELFRPYNRAFLVSKYGLA